MLTTTAGGIAALLIAAGGFLFRRRISKNWISRSSICVQQFTKEQTTIITGGNTGIGYEVAKDLANCGCKVIIACRDSDAGNLAALNIRKITGNRDVVCMTLDLSSLRSVRAFTTDLETRDDKCYALICNAGLWMPDKGAKTKDGFEIHFGVNHLGHFALVQSLIPQLEQSGMDSRIIFVGSTLCKSGVIDLQKRDFIYDGRVPEAEAKSSFAPTGYCDSKLMNMLTCRELAVRLRGSNTKITTYAVSPGFCQSQLGRNVNRQMAAYKKILFVPMLRLFQRSSIQGAYNILFVVMSDKTKLESGSMYQDGVVWEDGLKLIETLDDKIQKKLWDLSEELIKEKGNSTATVQ